MKLYLNKLITEMKPHEIFVFGSNLAGRHGKGAALIAKNKFGAQYGIGEGMTGRCYAFPTKDKRIKQLSLRKIETYVDPLWKVVVEHPNKTFLLTEVGCGLSNYTPHDIAPLFEQLLPCINVVWPKKFLDVLGVTEIKPYYEAQER